MGRSALSYGFMSVKTELYENDGQELSILDDDEPYWLDVPQWMPYKLRRTVRQCLQHKALQYMTDYCIHTSDTARLQHLRSAGCHQLFVPRHQCSTISCRTFPVAGPAAWNSSPDYPQDPSRSSGSFYRDLKTSLFSFY